MKSFYVVVQMRVLVHQVVSEKDARMHAIDLLQDFIDTNNRLKNITDMSELKVLSATTISGPVVE
jgi:hypothetical protein